MMSRIHASTLPEVWPYQPPAIDAATQDEPSADGLPCRITGALQRRNVDGAAPKMAHDPRGGAAVTGRPEALGRLRVDTSDQRFRQPAHDLPRDGLARVDEVHARADDLGNQRLQEGIMSAAEHDRVGAALEQRPRVTRDEL